MPYMKQINGAGFRRVVALVAAKRDISFAAAKAVVAGQLRMGESNFDKTFIKATGTVPDVGSRKEIVGLIIELGVEVTERELFSGVGSDGEGAA